ncbi:MAG: hypothetical protein ACLFWB_13640 [Armatimonadota bacterium]
MIVVLASEITPGWLQRIARHLGDRAMVLDAQTPSESVELARSLPVSVCIMDLQNLTRMSLQTYEQILQASPEVVTVCVAAQDAINQVRTEELLRPNFWLDPEASEADISDTLQQALERVELTEQAAETVRSPFETHNGSNNCVPPREVSANGQAGAHQNSGHIGLQSSLLHRMLSGPGGSFDTNTLLNSYLQAVTEYVRCANYCLLHRDEQEDALTVFASQGLHPAVVSSGQLLPDNALPRWYNQSSRILTMRELADWPDRTQAAEIAREMRIFRAHIAVPLLVDSRLHALLLLGEKALGEAYSSTELETLFVLSNYVSLQLHSFRLHNQLKQSRTYMEHILKGMKSGVVTLGPEGRIAVCNPYAADILGINAEEVQGSDIRCLPSPLGDHLYAAYETPGETVTNAEVEIPKTQATLRISTSALLDDQGEPAGSVMLLDDMTTEIELATERHRRERLNLLTQLVGGIAQQVRTPLQAIKTYSEVKQDPSSDDTIDDFWEETVTPEIRRLENLVTQLVQMVDQPEPDFELVDPVTLVENALDEASEDRGDEHIQVHIGSGLPRIVADPEPATEAIVYLLTYMEHLEGKNLTLSLREEETELGPSVCVVLQKDDTKPSLPPEELFDPFSALERTNGDLGPAISQRIIDNQGGQIDADLTDGNLQMRIVFPTTVIDAIST